MNSKVLYKISFKGALKIKKELCKLEVLILEAKCFQNSKALCKQQCPQ